MQRRAFVSSVLGGAVAIVLEPRTGVPQTQSGWVDLEALGAGPLRLRAAAQQSAMVNPVNAERYVRTLAQLVPKVPRRQRLQVVRIVVDAAAVTTNLVYDHDRPDRSAAIARTVHSLATEMGDNESAALMTARLSSGLVKLGRPDVALATLDRVRLAPLPPHVAALIQVHRAGAGGALRAEYEALTALERAEAALAASPPGERPGWARHWTQDYVRNWRVMTLGRLGQHERAESTVRAALASLPDQHARVRAHLLLCMAEISARRNALAESAAYAADALALTPSRADRFIRRARAVREILAQQFGDDPAGPGALGILDEALTQPPAASGPPAG